ncbi:MAG: ATP-binding protein [Prevotella sp.]|nr:ATP-binding protein [Prevotella sp.]
MERLQEYFDNQLEYTTSQFHRYMYNQIDWDNRLIGLVGPRGVGKTTLMLQHAKEHLPRHSTLFVTAEDMYFVINNIVEFAADFVKKGGRYLIIDEIHKMGDWARYLKLIHDYQPKLNVIFTGSSILDITKGTHDLSRRAIMYSMQGLSFREYLSLFHGINVQVYSLQQILNHEVKIPTDVQILELFKDYLQKGYYPFSKENQYKTRLKQVINNTLEVDIPQYAKMNVATGRKIKQLLGIIARSVPFKPNMSTLSTVLDTSRNSIADYFIYLEEAGMITLLRDSTSGVRALGKVNKVYLDNTALVYNLAEEEVNIGNIRETFFYNQMRLNQEVVSSDVADFTIDKYTFEIGGKNKKQKQIESVEDAFVVKDDIESGYLNVIPLWMFGLNY